MKILKEIVRDVRGEAVDRAVELVPEFMDIAGSLGLGVDDVNGLFEASELTTRMRTISYEKSKNHLGPHKAEGENGRGMRRCSGRDGRYLLILCP